MKPDLVITGMAHAKYFTFRYILLFEKPLRVYGFFPFTYLVFIDKQFDWNKVDESIVAAIKNANTTAENFAATKFIFNISNAPFKTLSKYRK
ncbi:hypothetical protein [Dolichospermum sp. UHCC 0299]|uniref:hypothetical protein n=1 Tax=Dolichospermum sp. UHCC 0299 TaxID=2590014 RepID=UPI001445F3A7|nr:hypothetical protein [Dolichospermum sp. UHCC 0299]MTJ19244.1 hypothetical protein [Dolichospermum sp. UHCC 0299]